MKKVVVEARRKGTIYLMKYVWLEESLTVNRRKPINEINERYTWEINHAKKVLGKRTERRKNQMRAKRAAARLGAKGMEDEVYHIGNKEDKLGISTTMKLTYTRSMSRSRYGDPKPPAVYNGVSERSEP